MDLPRTLGLEPSSPNHAQRALQQVAASRPGAWVLSRMLHHLDQRLMRLSKGRLSAPGSVTGLPTVLLTTTGARSGLPRFSPLVGLPHGEDVVLLGTGWGQHRTPSWVHNLDADPRAKLSSGGTEIAVDARRAAPEELPGIWETARELFRGYAEYPSRASHRDIAVFVLSAAG
ncbi:MAG: nitroreductase family deazaflavin-dependent oxidoreductase [Acidimicrobiia bacterium]